MKRRWLLIKVFFIHWLQVFGILPMIWYKSEIDLAEIKGKELAKIFDNCGSDHERRRG